jgi:hypothetical protein
VEINDLQVRLNKINQDKPKKKKDKMLEVKKKFNLFI